MLQAQDLVIKTLGPCRIDSPLGSLVTDRRPSYHNVDESDRVLFDDTASILGSRGLPVEELPAFEPAGARRRIFFDPSKTRAGIVTCGGLCPGLNDVIRALVLELSYHYGIRKIYGFCNGYQGLIAKYKRGTVDLTPESVSGISEHGGTILGTSRGRQDPVEMVDCLERLGFNVLFVIGGDGTLRGARLRTLTEEDRRSGARRSRSSGSPRRSTTTSCSSTRASASRPRSRPAPSRSGRATSRPRRRPTAWAWSS